MPDDPTIEAPTLTALAVNVAIPEHLRWRATRRGVESELQSITVRLLADGSLAAKAYGRPVAGGRGGYVSFTVPADPAIRALVEAAATAAAGRWADHAGLPASPGDVSTSSTDPADPPTSGDEPA